MSKPLVSIITPCYNGGKFVHRFLESVLNQTYRNIELIFVNDGSTDNTEEIVSSYIEKFVANDMKLIYIYQENAGQAAALNKGLKIFEGEYLTWPDSDDILHPDNIKNKVEFLEENQQYGLVLCKSRMIDEFDIKKQIGVLERKPNIIKDNLFHDLIIEKNVFFAPGGYLVRRSCFINTNKDRHIYECKSGQNWQMLLPITYNCDYGYLDEFLYDYLVRSNSHSRMEISKVDLIQKTYNHEDTLLTVIKDMNIIEETYYIELIREKYLRQRLMIGYSFDDKNYVNEQYNLLKEIGKVKINDRIIHFCSINNNMNSIYKVEWLYYSRQYIVRVMLK